MLNETGWRGSAELWLEAAYESLLEAGVDSVRIQPLAKKLSLSRTSFYWFFKDREELLSALVHKWRSKNTGSIVRQAEAYAESVTEAVFNVYDCWFNHDMFDSKFEYAIRSWALQSPDVSDDVSTADKFRLDALTKMFLRFGYDPLPADVRARSIYLAQIGYITMKTNETLAFRMKRAPIYVEIFTGRTPRANEVERFYARNGYVSPEPWVPADTGGEGP
ncbi:TetR/AcrR family transcriptional regulator [Pseudoxanthobacter sp.]|uniref:TetR/AcrR family transcriptional regulator n=1 Tax=Pseudoxanthobacter sp. TaxID=1925742 RepID=UPI002FE2327C